MNFWSLKFFGKKFLLYSILSTITFSSTYKIWEKIGFLVPSFTNNMLIASILAGIGVGVGVGLVVRGGGASGGDDVIALLGNKLLKLKVNHVYLATDAIVLLMSLVYLDIKQVFFSIRGTKSTNNLKWSYNINEQEWFCNCNYNYYR